MVSFVLRNTGTVTVPGLPARNLVIQMMIVMTITMRNMMTMIWIMMMKIWMMMRITAKMRITPRTRKGLIVSIMLDFFFTFYYLLQLLFFPFLSFFY